MNKLLNIAFKLAGKNDFELDPKISGQYISRLFLEYGMMYVRGMMVSTFNKTIDKGIFIGKNVKLYEKRLLYIGEKTKLHDNVKIDALSTDGVIIGKHVVLGKRVVIEATGSIKSIGKGVVIGDNSSFGSDCFFGAAGGITIGNDVIAGQYIRFHSENHNFENKSELIRNQGVTHKGIVVGNNCWIGAGAVFLDGSRIGDGCVVAANAVVTKEFPDNSIIGGVPAKVIGSRN